MCRLVRRAYPLKAIHPKYRHLVKRTIGGYIRLELYGNRADMNQVLRGRGLPHCRQQIGQCSRGPGHATATVYLCADRWNRIQLETIAHECTHATFRWISTSGLTADGLSGRCGRVVDPREEVFAYVHGHLVAWFTQWVASSGVEVRCV